MFPRQSIDRFAAPAISRASMRRVPKAATTARCPQELAMLLRLSAVVATMTALIATVRWIGT